jgi:hypothetical protein
MVKTRLLVLLNAIQKLLKNDNESILKPTLKLSTVLFIDGQMIIAEDNETLQKKYPYIN